jgi:regulation of enolase protein 1 (concanavalin A-like superfamily)
VTVVVSIASENVTVMLSVSETELWLSAVVETEDTVGAVVSVVVVLSVVVVAVAEYSSLSSLQEMMVRLKRDMRIMYKTLFIFFLHL